jgi:hypothetical protein
MDSKTDSYLVIALIFVLLIFIFCTCWAISGEMMKGDMNTSGWSERSWMLIPAVIALGFSDVLGWVILKRKSKQKKLVLKSNINNLKIKLLKLS